MCVNFLLPMSNILSKFAADSPLVALPGGGRVRVVLHVVRLADDVADPQEGQEDVEQDRIASKKNV